MEQKMNEKGSSDASPQKYLKCRSKSTDEIQQSKRAFSSQKSLPGRPELENVKEAPDGSETPSSFSPSSSAEELKEEQE